MCQPNDKGRTIKMTYRGGEISEELVIKSAKRRTLSLDEKAEVLKLSSGPSAKTISIQYHLKWKTEILHKIEKGSTGATKRLKLGTSHDEDLETAVFQWFSRMRSLNHVIQPEARRVAGQLNIPFSASRMVSKLQENISAVKLSGEGERESLCGSERC